MCPDSGYSGSVNDCFRCQQPGHMVSLFSLFVQFFILRETGSDVQVS